MRHHWTWHRVTALAREEWRALVTVHPSDRPWQMPASVALAAGLPMLIGAYFDHLDYGLVSSLGGMAFLYLPRTALHHRMVAMMACAFGLLGCYVAGLAAHLLPWLLVPAITLTAILAMMVCRSYRVGPPGSLFFVMTAAIAAYAPGDLLQAPLKVGLFALGSLLATLIAFVYSLIALRIRAPLPAEPVRPVDFDAVVLDSVLIGAAVGASLVLAQALHLDRPYWVPVSCLAVIQGLSVRAIWNRQLHRILGTALGLGVAAALLSLPLDKWSIAVLIMALSFVIETAVIRHYGFAVIFITPLTIFLADAATFGREPAGAIVAARFVDTALGCLVGLIGGILLHNAAFRRLVRPAVRRLTPLALLPGQAPPPR